MVGDLLSDFLEHRRAPLGLWSELFKRDLGLSLSLSPGLGQNPPKIVAVELPFDDLIRAASALWQSASPGELVGFSVGDPAEPY